MLYSKEGFLLCHDSPQVPMDLSCIVSECMMGEANCDEHSKLDHLLNHLLLKHGWKPIIKTKAYLQYCIAAHEFQASCLVHLGLRNVNRV